MTGTMVSDYTILGSFGQLFDTDGNFLSHIQEVTAQIQIDRQDIMTSGSRRVGYKNTSVHGEGTMRGFRVSSTMARRIANVMVNDRAPMWVGNIEIQLNDPETLPAPGSTTGDPQVERIQLQRCKWWGVNLGWAVNQIIEEDTPFTFQQIVWLRQIEDKLDASGGTPTVPRVYTPPVLPDVPKL